MVGLDTNMLIRFAVNDVPKQSLVVKRLLETNVAFISKTVLLETGWVLRSVYRFDRAAISEFFSKLVDSENAVIEDKDSVELGLHWHKEGADFADALHLSSSTAPTFHTFDKSFCKTITHKKLAPAIKVHQA